MKTVNENAIAMLNSMDGVFIRGTAAGIKKSGLDLALVFAPNASGSAGVFTKNKFRAPSVDFTKLNVTESVVRCIVANSGNANAGMGTSGKIKVEETARLAAAGLGISPNQVGIASTGKIGIDLPMDAIKAGLDCLTSSFVSKDHRNDASSAASAILTTDTFAKVAAESVTINGIELSVAGFSKGAGMIAPNMATTLSFIVSDVDLPSELLQSALSEAVNETFNMVSVDNDTSSNDMVLLIASGARHIDRTTESLSSWQAALTSVCKQLAIMLVEDGEGATKVIEATVNGAASKDEASQIAKSIINSPLVKTAIHGEDPNWGRVLAAAGKVGSPSFDLRTLDLYFGSQCIVSRGEPLNTPREITVAQLKGERVIITLNLHSGNASSTAWGCDLTHGYIDINVEYS